MAEVHPGHGLKQGTILHCLFQHLSRFALKREEVLDSLFSGGGGGEGGKTERIITKTV